MSLLTGARDSPLSMAQVQELQQLVPYELQAVYIKTQGDLDKSTSLRTLSQTDFFTKELDEMLLDGSIRIAVHSAKDLPLPIRTGLRIAAITKGIDSRDALVLRDGVILEQLPKNALIGTSSIRREESVLKLRKDLSFCDIRGTIGERLQLLDAGKVDGVVIAEAALIRLKLTSRNRIYLPGPTVPLQGKLAILARADDLEIQTLFASLHDEAAIYPESQ